MTDTTMFWVLGGMQGVTIFLVGWIKVDIGELWKRANTHGHQITCDHETCKPKTTGVVLHET